MSSLRTPSYADAPLLTRWRAMSTLAWRMMFHDKLKMMGTVIGVVFAVVLSNQQGGTFLGLIKKNTMFVDQAGADIWIVPPGTQTLQPGSRALTESTRLNALATPGVAWAEPLIYGGGSVLLPAGGTEQVTLIGTHYPVLKGGPWNVIAGRVESLSQPDTVIFEDAEREKLGGLNLGSMREMNNQRVRVGGFTWGLLPFGPSFAFADIELARRLLGLASDQVNFVLIGVLPGQDAMRVAQNIQNHTPEAMVMTTAQFRSVIVRYLLVRSAIGVTFGTSTVFALIVGFVIVALSMFSAVVDNIREFGTLKAMGATNWDLAKLLFVQSVTFACIGSLIGLSLVTQLANAIRSPKLALQLPPVMYLGTTLLMMFICIAASSLALLRLRKVEPAMVFR